MSEYQICIRFTAAYLKIESNFYRNQVYLCRFLRELGTSQGFKDEDIANVRQTHLQHKGMTTAEAEMKYLEVCKQLSGYGVFNFSAKDAKDVQVSIGISAHGINIYREQIRLHRFTWQNIIKIFYRKHSFGIRVKAGEVAYNHYYE